MRRAAPCCLLLLGVSCAWAGLDDVKVSIAAANQPLRVVLAELGKQAEFPITVDDRVPDAPVVLDLRDQSLRRALDLLCRGAGLVWYPQGSGALVSIDPTLRVALDSLGDLPAVAVRVPVNLLTRPVTVGFENIPLPDAVTTLERLSGTRLQLDPAAPTGVKIHGTFHQAPLARCLYMLCVAAGLYVRPGPGHVLHLLAPDRITAVSDGQEPETVELYPAGFRGVLGYLLVDDVWQNPARYGVRIRFDERHQPQFDRVTSGG